MYKYLHYSEITPFHYCRGVTVRIDPENVKVLSLKSRKMEVGHNPETQILFEFVILTIPADVNG